jgi:tripartite ATP-independent transporter DctP family solute receptor
MRRRTFGAGGAAAFASIAFVHSPAKAAQFDLKCSSSVPADHPLNIRAAQMFAAIETESQGRVHITLFPAGQLGGDTATFSQLRSGAIGLLFNNPGNLASVVPPADIMNLGFAFTDADEALRTADGPLGGYIRAEVAAKGLVALNKMWDSGMYQFASNPRPLRTPADLLGFKIRVAQSRISVDLFNTLGASPVALTIGEVYTSLQTKIVDGVGIPMTTLDTLKLYEVCKYLSLSNWAWSGLWLMVNGDLWKSLPPDLQQIVDANNTKFALLERRDTKAFNASVVQRLAQHGLAVNAVDQAPFRARLQSYYATWANAFGSTAWSLLQSSLGRKLA